MPPCCSVLEVVQALLLGAWWFVEGRRARSEPVAVPRVTRFEPARGPAPELRFVRRDGSAGRLERSGDRVLVHFWATWCPPCIEELPSLLAWAERAGVELLAVSVDPQWAEVEEFFGGTLPPSVVRAEAETARRWGADELPATFAVDDGRWSWTVRGPVRWETTEVP